MADGELKTFQDLEKEYEEVTRNMDIAEIENNPQPQPGDVPKVLLAKELYRIKCRMGPNDIWDPNSIRQNV